MSGLSNALTGASVTIGAALLANLSYDLARQLWSARVEARKLAKELEATALQSNDIAKLGEYLYDNIGATRVSNYVNDSAVRERVKQALGSVLTFLGPEETTITSEETEEAEQAEQTERPRRTAEFDERYSLEQSIGSEMGKALEEIRFGEVWNGLARMRRYIEARLRTIASEFPNIDKMSLSPLLDILTRQERIPLGIARQLRYAIRVANAGIHGTDIDRGQAEEAWRMAAGALAELELPSTG
jgi:hypothetical protein